MPDVSGGLCSRRGQSPPTSVAMFCSVASSRCCLFVASFAMRTACSTSISCASWRVNLPDTVPFARPVHGNMRDHADASCAATPPTRPARLGWRHGYMCDERLRPTGTARRLARRLRRWRRGGRLRVAVHRVELADLGVAGGADQPGWDRCFVSRSRAKTDRSAKASSTDDMQRTPRRAAHTCGRHRVRKCEVVRMRYVPTRLS